MSSESPIRVIFAAFLRSGLRARRTRLFILLGLLPALLMIADGRRRRLPKAGGS